MYKNEMTWRIRVYGIVQGVGFRPTVSRHATNHGIYGTVCNKGPYVEIYAQGTKEQIEGFLNSLKEHPPKRAAVLKINTENITADTTEQFEHFDIIESEKTKGEIFISPDIVQFKGSAVSASVYQLHLLWTKAYDSGCSAV